VNLDSGNFYPLMYNDGKEIIWKVTAYEGGDMAEAEIVVDPGVTLGMNYTAFDNYIMEAANQYGIPPTLSKAQIYVEDETFDPNAYRYEPYGYDYKYIAIGAQRGAGTVLDEFPYNHWNIRIPSHNPQWPAGPLNQGDWLTASADIDFRNRYLSGTTDTDGDTAYSVWEIVDDPRNSGENWQRPPVDFIAQSTMAASYGLKQVWWEVGLHPLHWNDGRGGHPADLCEPRLNIFMGTHYLRYIYDNWTLSSQPWNERWRSALVQYNQGYGADPSASNYDENVYYNLRLCMPVEQ